VTIKWFAFLGLSAYLRHAPEHPGRWRLALLAVKWAPLLTGAGTRIVRVKDGFRLNVDGASQTGRIAYALGEYEAETADRIRASLRQGDVMIDVGANIGYFTLVGAKTVGAAGRVVAFEPVPQVREQLAENVRLNGASNVEIRSDALSDVSGAVTFYLGPNSNTGLGSLRALTDGQTIEVNRVRFDDWWQPIAKVALVKIDVEGAELAVLRGMERCLARDRPDIVVEVTDAFLRALGDSAAGLFDFITSHGYRFFAIEEHGLREFTSTEQVTHYESQFNAFCSIRPVGA